MTDRPWLLLDVSALAYRALFSIGGDLSHRGVKTGVVFGVFRAVLELMELHDTHRTVWCFDRGCGKRLELRKD
ncbi:MAG: hypothetical protein KKB59_02090, partial [Spirochaetes bacterium]|nr:hypothetical protein [Spirochaetota bacterium]